MKNNKHNKVPHLDPYNSFISKATKLHTG